MLQSVLLTFAFNQAWQLATHWSISELNGSSCLISSIDFDLNCKPVEWKPEKLLAKWSHSSMKVSCRSHRKNNHDNGSDDWYPRQESHRRITLIHFIKRWSEWVERENGLTRERDHRRISLSPYKLSLLVLILKLSHDKGLFLERLNVQATFGLVKRFMSRDVVAIAIFLGVSFSCLESNESLHWRPKKVLNPAKILKAF